jgi:D-galactarolactone cycloisomerase
MARIRDIRLIPLAFQMPQIKAYGMARRLVASRGATLVEVETEDGVVGIGEAWGPAKAAAGYLELIRGEFVGCELYGYGHAWSRITSGMYHLGLQNQMTGVASGINIAIYDAIGKIHGVAVCKLLGGRGKERVPVYASGGYLTNDPDNQLQAQLERVADKGFPGAKFKIGISPKSDEQRVALARRILGDDILLLVDVNGNYTVDLALESMRRTAPYGIHYYEEPLPPQDVEGYKALARRAPVAIAAGEALYTVFDFDRLISARAVDVVQPDLTLCGGLDQAKAIAVLCQLHNVGISPHVWGSPVGLAAALHFMAALPDYPHTDHMPYPRMVEYDVGENPLRDHLLARPLRPVAGQIQVPDGPGLGIELDPEAVQRFKVA